jgi:hypothetical protein
MMHDGGPVVAQHGYTVEKWAARMTSWRGVAIAVRRRSGATHMITTINRYRLALLAAYPP